MKNKLKKKAYSPQAWMVGLILLVAILIIYIYFYSSLGGNVKEGVIREVRQQNVNNHVKAHIAGLDLSSELNFPIIRMDIEKDDELKDSSKALVHDWYDLLEGEGNLFPQEREKIVYCVPGHYIKFKAKDKKIPAMEYAEFQRTNTLDDIGAEHMIGEDTDVSIKDYIAGYTTDKTIFEQEMKTLEEELGKVENVAIIKDEEFFKETKELNEGYAINTNYEYMTVTVYMKKSYWAKWLTSLAGTGAGVTVGLILVPFTGGGSLVITSLVLGGGAVGGAIGYSQGSWKSADYTSSIWLVPNKEDILEILKCDLLPARGEV